MNNVQVNRDIAVVGASAGGVEALRVLVRALPRDYAATLFVVLHVAPESPSILDRLLDNVSSLPVRRAEDGRTFRRGEIWVAPPDHHLVLREDAMQVSRGPRENRHRPSIDVLFRSAAIAYGPRVTGVVLTGMLDDGAAGLWAVKTRGGIAVVQDPDDAAYPDMPMNALEVVETDHCLPLADIPACIAALARERVLPRARTEGDKLELEVRMAVDNTATMEQLDALGERSTLTCPECGGALWEMHEPPPRFRCHVGHAYTMRTLVASQSERLESALWAALRELEESEALARRIAEKAVQRHDNNTARIFTDRAGERASHADVLRQLLKEIPAAAAVPAGSPVEADSNA